MVAGIIIGIIIGANFGLVIFSLFASRRKTK